MRELTTPVRDGLGALVPHELAAAPGAFARNARTCQWVFIGCARIASGKHDLAARTAAAGSVGSRPG
jgi:hypothetical protein